MKILDSYRPGSQRFQADLSRLCADETDLIFLMRHGRIAGDGKKRFIGHTDVPLDESGRTQARTWHNACGAIPFGLIYSSALQRCRETASLVCPDRQINVDPRLNEINMGTWDGKSFEEIKATMPLEFERRGQKMYHFRPPDGESFQDLFNRVYPFFTNNINKQPPHKRHRILVLTHAGVIRSVVCHLLRMNPATDLFTIPLDYGQLFVISSD